MSPRGRRSGVDVSSIAKEAAGLLCDKTYPDWQTWVWGGNLLDYLPGAIARLAPEIGIDERIGIVSAHWHPAETVHHVALVRSFRIEESPDPSSVTRSFEWATRETKYQIRKSGKGWAALRECLLQVGGPGLKQFP